MSEAKSKAIEHKQHDHKHVKPVTSADKKLAKKHLKETIKFEKRKAKEHIDMAKSGKGDKEYNHSHADHHMQDVLERKKMLTSGNYL